MAEIRFKCPECKQRMAVEAAAIGLQVDCPTCRSTLVVPAKSDDAPSVAVRRRMTVFGGTQAELYEEIERTRGLVMKEHDRTLAAQSEVEKLKAEVARLTAVADEERKKAESASNAGGESNAELEKARELLAAAIRDRDTIATRFAGMEQLREAAGQAQVEMARIRQERSVFATERDAAREHAKKAEGALFNLQSRLVEGEKERSELRAHISLLQVQFEESIGFRKQCETLQDQVAELEKELKSASSEREQKRVTAGQASAEVNALKAQLAALKLEVRQEKATADDSKWKEQVASLEAALTTAQRSLEDADKSRAELLSKIEEITKDREANVASAVAASTAEKFLRDELAKRESALGESDKALDAARQELEQLRKAAELSAADKAKLQGQLVEVGEKLSQANAKAAEADASGRAAIAAKEQEFRSELSQRESAAAESARALEAIRAELDQVHKIAAENAEAKARLEEQLKEVGNQLKEMRAKADEAIAGAAAAVAVRGKEFEVQLAENTKALGEARAELDRVREAADQAIAGKNRLEADLKKASEQLAESTANAEKIRIDLAAAAAGKEAELQSELSKREAALAESASEKARIEAALAEARGKLEQLKAQSATSGEGARAKDDELADLRVQLERTAKERDEARRQIADRVRAYDEAAAGAEAALMEKNRLASANQTIAEAHEKSRKEAAAAQEKLAGLQKESDRLHEMVAEAQKALESSWADHEQTRVKLQAAEGTLREHAARLAQAELLEETQKGHIDHFQRQLADARQKLEDATKAYDAERGQLQMGGDVESRLNAELASAVEQRKSLEEKISLLQREVSDLGNRLNIVSGERDRARAEMTKLNKELDRIGCEKSDAEQLVQGERQKLQPMIESHDQLAQQVQAARQEIDRLKGELATAHREREGTGEAAEPLQARLVAAENLAKAIAEERDGLKAELVATNAGLERAKQHVAVLQSRRDQLREEVAQLKESLGMGTDTAA